jgi:hypothetical protein
MVLDKFSTALDLLKGFQVNLYVGEEIIKGKLMGVETDHVVIEDEHKYIFYYSIDKIQAITKNTKQFQVEEITTTFQKTQSLTELLHSFRNSWVSILCLNKKRFSGVLSDIDADFATIINGEERILIKLTHISNILKGFIQDEETKETSSKGNEQNKNKASNNNQEKNDKDTTEQKKNNKSEKKSKETAKEVTKDSDKKSETSTKTEIVIAENQQPALPLAVVIEPKEIKVWSQPIKPEPVSVPLTELTPSTTTTTTVQTEPTKETEVSLKDTSDLKKSNIESKKPNTELSKEKKNEEPKVIKPKLLAPPKEIKPIKVEAPIGKSSSAAKSEEKPSKSTEKENIVKSSNSKGNVVKTSKTKENVVKAANVTESAVKASNVIENLKKQSAEKENVVKTVRMTSTYQEQTKVKNTMEQNNSVHSWKQTDQGKKAFRYAGEPVSHDIERDLTFSGRFNRQRRKTSRY